MAAKDKAEESIAKAEKALKKFNPFGNKHEDAKEHFVQAANYFKATQRFGEAGTAYLRAEECNQKLKSPMESAQLLVDAANMYKKVDVPKGMDCMQRALEMLDASGRYNRCAKLSQELAEQFEEQKDLPNAITWYDRASDYYKAENSPTTANQCRVKVAQFYALTEKYDEAVDIYESVVEHSLTEALLKSNCKTHEFMALLCLLAKKDPIDKVRSKFEEYQDRDPLFAETTREHALIRELLSAVEESNVDKFSEAVNEYDTVSPLDETKTKLLLRAKTALRPDLG